MMRSRLIPIVALVVLVIGVGGVIVSISVGENTVGDSEVGVTELEGIGEVQELIGGLRQLGTRLGNEDAPVTLNLFNDVQCPPCADYQGAVVEPLIERYVRDGEAKIVFRNFPLGQKPLTVGGIATEAAAEQDRSWQYLSLLMRNLDQVPERGIDEEFLDVIASATPRLETVAWEQAQMGEEARAAAEEDAELAAELELPSGTAIVVDGPAGSEQLEREPSLEQVEAAIERVG